CRDVYILSRHARKHLPSRPVASTVIPAQAGIHPTVNAPPLWIPACAGMTVEEEIQGDVRETDCDYPAIEA
ncbi:MAG: hypothetical protein R6W89_02690, partial [Candidatus Hydrogenedentota bacterium]